MSIRRVRHSTNPFRLPLGWFPLMNRSIAIAFGLLILSLLASCGDSGSPPPEHDIEATVEARVAEVLEASASTPIIMPKSASSTPPSGRIVFHSSYAGGRTDIYMMNADGSGFIRLTDNPDGDSSPRWSPDGSRIAFYSWRNRNYDIYVMNADGSALTNLTNSPDMMDRSPAWSPDGSQIAFVSVPRLVPHPHEDAIFKPISVIPAKAGIQRWGWLPYIRNTWKRY